ncbi:unnamed protein product [Cochlearia groenlandica]
MLENLETGVVAHLRALMFKAQYLFLLLLSICHRLHDPPSKSSPHDPLFNNRCHEKPQIRNDRAQSSFPFISDNIDSFRDRTRDIHRVVVALLFGVGCGALTAATMYLASALVVNRHSYDLEEEEEEDCYENEPFDEACLKKIG